MQSAKPAQTLSKEMQWGKKGEMKREKEVPMYFSKQNGNSNASSRQSTLSLEVGKS